MFDELSLLAAAGLGEGVVADGDGFGAALDVDDGAAFGGVVDEGVVLDAVAVTRRARVVRWLAALLRSLPASMVVVTSRFDTFDPAIGTRFGAFVVAWGPYSRMAPADRVSHEI